MIKSFVLASLLGLIAMAASSCCASCGSASTASTITERKIVGYRQVEQVVSTGAKGGMSETQIVQEPIYEEVQVKRSCSHGNPDCVRLYCADHGPCGSTGEGTLALATAQGSSGAPHIGLIPTMKPLAE